MMNDTLQMDQLRLGPEPELPVRLPRHRPGDHFLKGPIPIDWLQAAASAPGHALHVAVALWYQAGMKKNARIALSLSSLNAFGLSRYSASRGLKELERIKLVEVKRSPGRKPIVTLLDTTHRNPV